MTVREWFRIQRKAMWETKRTAATSEIDRLAYLIDFGNSPPPVEMLTFMAGVVLPEEWQVRTDAHEEAPVVLAQLLRVTYYEAGLALPGSEAVERVRELIRRDKLERLLK